MYVNLFAIACGGALGAATRYLISLVMAEKFGTNFPSGTLLVNMLGCLILGFVVALCLKNPAMPTPLKLFIITGFLGGLTTFSTFTLETFELLMQNTLFGFINLALSILGGLALVAVGMRLGQ